jgi:hypothetical protein
VLSDAVDRPLVTLGQVDVRPDPQIELTEALTLYGSVGWSAYTDHPDVLAAALSGSDLVVTARVGQSLVGLARTVSDGASISNREIASRLHLSERTVENHVRHIMQKVDKTSRAGVATWYLRERSRSRSEREPSDRVVD